MDQDRPTPRARRGRLAATLGATVAAAVLTVTATGALDDDRGDEHTTPATTARIPPPAVTTTTTAAPARELTVAFAGDSVAFGLGTASTPEILDPITAPDRVRVDVDALPGCSIAAGTHVTDTMIMPPWPGCADMANSWADTVTAVDPDVVVISYGAWDVVDVVELVDGVAVRHVVGTEPWHDHMARRFADLHTTLTAGGAQLIIFDVGCFPDTSDTGYDVVAPRADPARIAAANDAVERFAADHDDVTTFDWAALTCPDGKPTHIGGAPFRPDGVHPDPAHIGWFWTHAWPAISAAATGS